MQEHAPLSLLIREDQETTQSIIEREQEDAIREYDYFLDSIARDGSIALQQ